MTRPSQPRRTRSSPVQWYAPGELVVVVELPGRRQPSRGQLHGQLRDAIERAVSGRSGGLFRSEQSRADPIVFTGPDHSLAFLLYELEGDASHARVRDAVRAIHRTDVDALLPRRGSARAVSVMPHWLALAQVDCVGGSPGSLPRPVQADELPQRGGPWRYVYTAAESALDLQARADALQSSALVPVAVLDSLPQTSAVRRTAKRAGAVNAQLEETEALVDASPQLVTSVERREIPLRRSGRAQIGPAYDLSSHGLFVTSLVCGTARRAPVRLVPALSSTGVGDLESLLRALAQVLAHKKQTDPLVINLSLGLLPPLERLPFVWYSVDLPDDPGHVQDVVSHATPQPTDPAWLRSNSLEVQRGTQLLHAGLARLADLLLANNCLVVAAAGNDSLQRVEAGRRRLGPRVPACYRSVLGVAATGSRDTQAAAYSNMGDEWNYGDHVATFGGDVDASDEPLDGVIGVYAGTNFPDPSTGRASRSLPNETGWARWSGTSFATGLVSGLAANLWAVERGASSSTEPNAASILGQLAAQAEDFAGELGTRSIPITGRWERA